MVSLVLEYKKAGVMIRTRLLMIHKICENEAEDKRKCLSASIKPKLRINRKKIILNIKNNL